MSGPRGASQWSKLCEQQWTTAGCADLSSARSCDDGRPGPVSDRVDSLNSRHRYSECPRRLHGRDESIAGIADVALMHLAIVLHLGATLAVRLAVAAVGLR